MGDMDVRVGVVVGGMVLFRVGFWRREWGYIEYESFYWKRILDFV